MMAMAAERDDAPEAKGPWPLPEGWAWADFDIICQSLSDDGLKVRQRDYL